MPLQNIEQKFSARADATRALTEKALQIKV
jgi:hypothetical protein